MLLYLVAGGAGKFSRLRMILGDTKSDAGDMSSESDRQSQQPNDGADATLYQQQYSKGKKVLENTFRSLLSSSNEKMEQLPKDLWGVPPQLLLIGISPYGNSFNLVSNAFIEDPDLRAMLQSFLSTLSLFQEKKTLRSKEAARRGQAQLLKSIRFDAAPKQRKPSVFSKHQAAFSRHYRKKLLPMIQDKVNEEAQQGTHVCDSVN